MQFLAFSPTKQFLVVWLAIQFLNAMAVSGNAVRQRGTLPSLRVRNFMARLLEWHRQRLLKSVLFCVHLAVVLV
jgi:hypothetical protein